MSSLRVSKLGLILPDIGGVLYGNWVRLAILASIAVSQIGFVAGVLPLPSPLHDRRLRRTVYICMQYDETDVISIHHLHRAEPTGVHSRRHRVPRLYRDQVAHLCRAHPVHALSNDSESGKAEWDGVGRRCVHLDWQYVFSDPLVT